jgi:hypothetical protein
MRPPSLLVPCGGIVAVIGINLSVVKVGVHAPGSAIPVVSDLVNAIPEKALGAAADQRYYLLGVAVVTVVAWLLPRLVPRTNLLGLALAFAAAVITVLGAVRGWVIATEGPHALLTGDSSFLERSGLAVLDQLHAKGILVVHPAAGLWVLSAGAALLVCGVVLSGLRSSAKQR